MQENQIKNSQGINYPFSAPNAVAINIYSPQAYAKPQNVQNPNVTNPIYSLYNPNMGNMPIYPQNYNNMFMPAPIRQTQQIQQAPKGVAYELDEQEKDTQPKLDDSLNAVSSKNEISKTEQPEEKTEKDQKEEKVITPLTDEYIKSLENYLNNSNPKVRLIGAKELLERFKEDDNRKDNKSLVALLNKTLRDTASSIRFIGLTILQTGYSVGNEETVEILKEIQSRKEDTTGEDQLLASEILLKMTAEQPVKAER